MSDEEETPAASDSGQPQGEAESASLLELPESKAAKRLFKEWKRQTPLLRFRHQVWRVNQLRRMGYTNIFVRKDEDTGRWTAYAPPDARPNPVAMNKAGRLCERLAATMFTDPPVPECMPSSDSDDDRDSAEFGTRLLQVFGSEAHLNTPLKAQHAFDLGSTYDSGWVRYWVDPRGNGVRKMEVMAHPTAPTLDLAVRGPDGTPWAANELVTRYVMPDGKTLTDDPEQAGEQQLPKLRSEVLTGLHVRLMPATARDVWEAEAVMVAALVPLGRLKSAFKDKLDTLSDDQLKELVTKHPEGVEQLLPVQARKRFKEDMEKGKVDDESLVFSLTFYHVTSPLYPKGAYVCAAGSDDTAIVLHRSDWSSPEGKREPMDIPVSQFKQWDMENDTWGLGAMGKLGPGNEARAYLQGALFEQTDHTLNRKVFVPITSSFQAKSAQAMMGTHIPINPGGEPKYEEVPELPAGVKELHQQVTDEMDDEIGLQLPAQGVNPSGVKSGLHAQQLIEQTNVGLAGPRNNTLRAILRCWRIEMQLTRAFMTVPQQVSIPGDDGLYKQRSFSGTDLGSTKDVQLAKGSFTMLAPSAKLAVAQQAAQLQLIDGDDLHRIMSSNVGGLIGMQDNPIRARVRRQLGAWLEGPPDEVKALQETYEQQPAQPIQQPDGSVVLPPSPMEQHGARIFTPIPVDEEQDVATIRHLEIRRTIAGTKFSRWPAAWQAPLLAEYQRMRQAAGKQTLAEQQAAAQQQAQQQQLAQQQEAQQRASQDEATRSDRRQAADRQADIAERRVAAQEAKAMQQPMAPVR